MPQSVALKPCPACGRSTNPRNNACPHCGHSFVQQATPVGQTQAVQSTPPSPPPWAMPQPQHAPPSNAVPVWVMGCRYKWISDEYEAVTRYARIGVGIIVWGILLVSAWWIGAAFAASTALSIIQSGAPAGLQQAGLLLAAVVGVCIAIFVAGCALGGILRLLRDAFTHRIG